MVNRDGRYPHPPDAMYSRDRCPRCAKRVPYGGGRCLSCGAEPAGSAKRRPGRASIAFGVAAATLLGLFAFNYSDRYAPVVADWYTDMVIRYVPDSAMRFTPAGEDQRAFFACARRVVQRIEADASIATFASYADTEVLEEGRYRVRSYFDEALESGGTERRLFTCTIRLDGGNWVLEELEMAPPSSVLPDQRASR